MAHDESSVTRFLKFLVYGVVVVIIMLPGFQAGRESNQNELLIKQIREEFDESRLDREIQLRQVICMLLLRPEDRVPKDVQRCRESSEREAREYLENAGHEVPAR